MKNPSGAVGAGGLNPAPRVDDPSVRVAAEQLLMVPIVDLVPYANNARVHSKAQIAKLRASLREFGFVTPVLIDFDNNIIAGHGRVEASRAEGMAEVPCVLVSSLTEAQRKAYILADNRLSETAAWDEPMLRMELERLESLSFDTGLIGFSAEALEAFPIGAGRLDRPENAKEPEGAEEYRSFVDKFKPKLTTDDCYTPENVYGAVRDWAVRRYRLGNAEVIRPFWPGGDYQGMEYPEGCVVIDNPPFSILSEICRFYAERGVRYFMFAPALTLFSTAAGSSNYVPVGVSVTYANGAVVSTSFVTNLGEYKVEIAPDLYRLVKAADDASQKNAAQEMPEYVYPDEVLTIAIQRLAKKGRALRIRAEDTMFVRGLDSQRAEGKAIFGAGFLLSSKATKNRAAADRAVAEKESAIVWELSDRERTLIQTLGQ